MNRRGFLQGIIAAATAPAFVRADSLMGLYVPARVINPALVVNRITSALLEDHYNLNRMTRWMVICDDQFGFQFAEIPDEDFYAKPTEEELKFYTGDQWK